MPRSIKERKRDAVRGVVLFGAIQLVCVLCFVSLCFIPELPGWAVALFGALAIACVIPCILALVALKQRFQEIEGGELDAAAQY